MRDITELLKEPGALRRLVREQGRLPKDLLAGCISEPFQGEGGYVPGDPRFFKELRDVCDDADALLIVDEVQSVARTGRLYMTEHLDVRPDVLCTAKSMVLGTTIVRADVAQYCHMGWHSNTWGAGRILDTNFAWSTLDTLLHHKEPAFQGLNYIENTDVKGRYLAVQLERLAAKHPDHVSGQRGEGLMRALLVRDRNRVTHAAWQRGLKLLGCGWGGDVAAIRLLLLADTTTREIDELIRVLDETFSSLSA